MNNPVDCSKLDRRQTLKAIAFVPAAYSSFSLLDGLSPEAAFAEGREIHEHLPAKASMDKASKGLSLFDARQNKTVVAISELIIPQTSSPGAKLARVNEFIDVYLASRPKSKQAEFIEGLDWVDRRSVELFKRPFVDCSPEQQKELLTRLSITNSAEDIAGQSFFRLIKSLTVFGYYTSKEGIEQELKFQGWIEYEGCTHPEHQATKGQGS